MKKFICTLFLGLLFTCLSAQTSEELWTKTTQLERNSIQRVRKEQIPKEYDVYRLNLNLLKSKLVAAPQRVAGLKKSNSIISFPNTHGKLEQYYVFEASVMEDDLQKKHPEIRSYTGKGIDNPNSTIRFSVTPLGLSALISNTTEGNIYIDSNNNDSYLIYSAENLPEALPFECGFDENNQTQQPFKAPSSLKNANDGNLRTFRLALVVTGEYSQYQLTRFGISENETDSVKKNLVLAVMAETLIQINPVFERDLGLTMVLVSNIKDIIFLDPTTDNLTNTSINALLSEAKPLVNVIIGAANYDFVHLFSAANFGGISNMGGGSCSIGTAVTTSPWPDGGNFERLVKHEMGHQFGATHTFNGCGTVSLSGSSLVETGSGSTLMGYAASCGSQNVQIANDEYFHLTSIRKMWAVIGTGTCGTLTNINNSAPTIDDLNNYTIPVSTPFYLDAKATDNEGNNLTYTWEQLDVGFVTSPPVATSISGPAMRSMPPSISSRRYFPNQNTIASGAISNTWEMLPSFSRTMKFGVTVRDNNPAGGQTSSKETTVSFDMNAGPFKVTSQSTVETWDAGMAETITWDVANTNLSPINCNFVNILLSVDGGYTFPTVLASNVPNNGSYNFNVPNISTNTARVKVESVDNIFYAVNKVNIAILSVPTFRLVFNTTTIEVCSPNTAVYTANYLTTSGFNENTVFTASGNPAGTTVTFNPASAMGNNTNVEMIVSGIQDVHAGQYQIVVTTSSTSKVKTTALSLNVFYQNISSPVLLTPSNNSVLGIAPYTLSWNSDANVTEYSVQISTDILFSNIIETADLKSASYIPQLLKSNTKYFWRIIGRNICNENVTSPIFSFTTQKVFQLYGMTSYGGIYYSGSIYLYDVSDESLTKRVDLKENITGAYPKGSLIQAFNGKLYGYGGSGYSSTLIEYDLNSNTLIKKNNFTGFSNGNSPFGNLIQATNGKLYGMTYDGGMAGGGVIFEYNIVSNVLLNIKTLDTPNGQKPYGSLTQASNGKLYGMTSDGGASKSGVLFEFDVINKIYTKKIDLDQLTGKYPYGSLIQATNGNLYGMTSAGGDQSGVLFEYNIVTNSYTKKHDFYTLDGISPNGSPLQASNGKLYGMTTFGGAFGFGVLFEFDLISNVYRKIIDFDGINKGKEPYGDLMQASNGKIYGFTKKGGKSDLGVIFEYDPSTDIFTKKKDFNGLESGSYPCYNKLLEINGDDYDKDGVNNSVDLCPNTNFGESVNQDGCSVNQLLTVGIIDNAEQVVSILSNPVKDILDIQFDGEVMMNIKILNMQGAIVRLYHTSNKKINVSDLTKGIYILEIRNENDLFKRIKFIKS